LIELENAVVYHGSNLDVLPTLPDNSVDAIVTDPPYELGFMGKSWDSSGIAYSVELWQECLRVLKPGGHLLAFSGSRTYHRMTVAIEDAGFEVRDMIAWVSNKTFPKSHNISKAIDKAAGAEREVVGTQKLSGDAAQTTKEKGGTFASATNSVGVEPIDIELTASATDEAKKWDGWGTALKPTVEPVVMARKPFDGTIANNVLTWGVGGLNIDGSRIGTEERTNQPAGNTDREAWRMNSGNSEPTSVQGRWPANIILDEHTAGLLDEQSGHLHGDGNKKDTGLGTDVGYSASSYQMSYQGRANRSHNDSGGASRFFYVARASKTDRNEGLEDLPEIGSKRYGDRNAGTLPQQTPQSEVLAKNFHPTVKPTALMEYLVKLVTPEGGTVLDPFTGSGSTGKAALLNGFKFIGIELTADYLPIIEGRLKHAAETYANQAKEEETKEQETLF
jgi:site-specific DNA-methyltransferase (adenine-specific)